MRSDSSSGAASRSTIRTAVAIAGILCHCYGARAAEECRACHPAQARKHGATRHARALQPIVDTEFFRRLPGGPIVEARGGFALHYTREGDSLRVVAERGSERAAGVIEWAFGAGAQALTPVLRMGDRQFEHRISFYQRPGRYDLTLGHLPGVSENAEAALGVEQPKQKAAACFGCHSSANGIEVRRAGVDCAHCHAGSAEHARSKGTAAARSPRKLSARAEVDLCAACHRLTPPVSANDPLNIRFQPLRLVQSRCYLIGGVRCASCHAAHEDVSSDGPAYRAACLACHASQSQKGSCVECHMPKSMPAPYLTFTDHFIRVVRP